MEENETKTRFFKHRRNMLLLSGVFVFLTLSGGSVESVDILGSKLTFKNPDAPLDIIFICMIYMLIKYVQFLSEMGGTGIKGKIRSLVQNKVTLIAKVKDDKLVDGATDLREDDYDIIRTIGYFTYVLTINTQRSTRAKRTLEDSNNEELSAERTVGFKELWKEYLKALVHIVFKTVWFAEYILPILLAVCGFILYFFPDIVPQFFLSTP
ncbi:MAG: hypothetical protein JAY64_19315 [Candidatus Thiodiazotropha weberae]|nr:hypothetical protein [Candidatus Thiodiazotropha lotti]MCG8013827.1 hypothetical protein [Candidatus Thiodiazotropha lotti]MCW4213308.1 hypothetical protein [Candidatus Thiodiazotropha lotti]MCW4217180.1 hypothetical protein [Candidatus Thiodiazotropha lotti]